MYPASAFSVCRRVLSSRWMLPILNTIAVSKRFGDIQDTLDGLSRGVLASQLQELLSMGLITQRKYVCFPPKVEYQISEKGRELMEILSALPK
ncbi:MAG: helix-turn-helix transcriptional regulator [Oscillospiraceae bacterium]|nr:helix-turn-helix transcriptional regulator [Oscillospiraceae bacterium]